MAYVNPRIQPRLEELSPELREAILSRDVNLYSLNDLIGLLAEIIREEES